MRLCTWFTTRPAEIAVLVVMLLTTQSTGAWAITYYSSPVGQDPTSVANWWTYPDGTGTNPADFASGDMFVIQSGHSMSTAGTWAISGPNSALWIQGGGMLTAGDGGANGLRMSGSTFQIDAGGTYVHDCAADWAGTCLDSLVVHNFNAASTVILRATPVRPGANLAWGNLTIDLTTSPGTDWNWDGRLVRVYGDLTVTNTGGHEMRLGEATNPGLTVHGDVIIDGGNLQLGSGPGSTTLNVAGDFVMTAGTFGSSSTGIHTVVFTGGTAPRTYTQSGGTLAVANVDWRVDTGTLTLAGAFTLPAPRVMTIGSVATLVLPVALTNAGPLRVNGVLRLEAGGSLGAAPAYGGNGVLVYAGGSRSTGPEWGTAGPDIPLYVTLEAGEGNTVTLSGDRTVYETLTFVSGSIATGADTLTLGPTCGVVGAGPGRYVHGNLARVIPATLTAPVAFDIGDAASYTPVVVAFDTVTAPGTLTASTAVPGAPPAAGDPPAGSGLSQSTYVDRSWTLTNSVAFPVSFGSCAATFHFVGADVVGGGDPAAFLVARDSSGTWSHPTVGDALATSITATGLTGFGEFRIGGPIVALYALTVTTEGSGTVTRDPDLQSYPEGSTVELTATPAEGWAFAGWSGDAAGRDNPLTLTMDAERSVTAAFVEATLTISQVYGGGGAKGAPYTHDFIELFNRGPHAVDITGWTVQYAASADSAWSTTPLAGTIPAGGYYLVQEARGVDGLAALPAPDAIGTIQVGAKAGKVALVSGGGPLSGACPQGPVIVDFVGYDGANCSEGSPVGTLSNLTAALRNGEGCDDTDNNLLDFTVAAPAPRNSASPVHFCDAWADVEPAPITQLLLAPPVPNPTRGGARVSFALPAESAVRLRVVDLQGRVTATLADGVLPAGRHEAIWTGSTPGGAARPGLYFVRLEAGGKQAVRSVILVR